MSKFPQKVVNRCEGLFQSSATIEDLFVRYKANTGSRIFFRLCFDMVDENIEKLATITEACRAKGFSPQHHALISAALDRAQGKSWEVLEMISKYAKEKLGDDFWENP